MKRFCFVTVIILTIIIGLLGLIGCKDSCDINERLNIADSLMEEHPHSSLSILDSIDSDELKEDRIKARYALLKSMALDKNYIDTTNFDVLQPAIDYYLKNGNANERLRTYYYQGIIYKNAGDDDGAIQSFFDAFEIDSSITDSLTLARLLVAQGTLFSKLYRIGDLVNNNLKSAEIYGRLGKSQQQLKSYLRALNGEIILNNKPRADSIFMICNAIANSCPSLREVTVVPFMKYAVGFDTNEKVNNLIAEVGDTEIPDDMKLTLAKAYAKIGEPSKGLQYLEESKIASDDILDSLSYWAIKKDILEKMGEAKASLDAFKNYSRLLEEYHTQLFSNELLFSEKKHEMDMESLDKIHRRDNAIKWILAGVAVLICVIGLVYYRYRLNKAGRLIAEQNAEKLKLKNENLQLETEKLQLEADNLRLEIGQLEEEQERLSGLLNQRDILSEEARQLIRERIDLLNGLLAKAITNEDTYGKEFQKYVDKIKKDKKKFQQSIGKVLRATHPAFMKYLEAHGLTDREIDFVCLYAIGLRGKEIGNYLDLARHYNIATDIRKKLGLDTNDTNLGPFIRKMMSPH